MPTKAYAIRDLDEQTIKAIQKHAKKHGFKIAGAVKDLIAKGLKND